MTSSAEDIAFDRAYVRAHGLYGLLVLCWNILCPGEVFKTGPHVRQVAQHLEAASLGLMRRLLINVPPGSTKSLLASVVWPAYVWGPLGHADKKWMFCSYAGELATRDANRCRDLIRSAWFQERWPDLELEGVAQSKYYTTTLGGWRVSEAITGNLTGRHPDILVIDDPTNAKNAISNAAELKTDLLKVQAIWSGVLFSRGADQNTNVQVIIMQRLHDEDLCGHLLSEAATGGVLFQHLRLPMYYEADNPCATYLDDGRPFCGDWRTIEGAPLCEERWSPETLKNIKHTLGNEWSAQYQQRPANKLGQIFRRAWFKYWDAAELAREGANPHTGAGFDEVICSWDLTFKDTLGSDFVCGQVWGRLGPNYYLLDRVYRRLSFPNTLTAIETQLRRWTCIGAKLIEDKANGPAVMAVLERKVSGLIEVNPQGSKVTRANAVSYLHRAGNVFYPPEYQGAAGEDSHVEQMAKFPLAKHDDSVDAETQALLYFLENRNALYDAIAAMSRGQGGTERVWQSEESALRHVRGAP